MVNDVYLVMGSYMAVILIGFGIVNFFTGGVIIPLMRVKMSRGRLILIRIRTVTTDYFKPGQLIEGWLVFKDAQKAARRIECPDRSYIARAMGVNTVDVDDELNAVIKADFSAVQGFDAVKMENLHVRALTAPHLEDNLLKIVLVIVVIGVLATLICAFLIFKLTGKVDALSTISTAVQNATI